MMNARLASGCRARGLQLFVSARSEQRTQKARPPITVFGRHLRAAVIELCRVLARGGQSRANRKPFGPPFCSARPVWGWHEAGASRCAGHIRRRRRRQVALLCQKHSARPQHFGGDGTSALGGQERSGKSKERDKSACNCVRSSAGASLAINARRARGEAERVNSKFRAPNSGRSRTQEPAERANSDWILMDVRDCSPIGRGEQMGRSNSFNAPAARLRLLAAH